MRSSSQTVRFLALLFVFVLASCPKNPPHDQGGSSSDGKTGTQTSYQPKSPEEEAKQLDPIIRELGAPNVNPRGVVVEFGKPIFNLDSPYRENTYGDSEEESEETSEEETPQPVSLDDKSKVDFEIQPAIPGKIQIVGHSSLFFMPNLPFAEDTTYTVTLKSVTTDAGKITPPSGTSWTHQFTTPKLRLLHTGLFDTQLLPEAMDPKKQLDRNITVRMVFSVTVDPIVLDHLLLWSLDGQPVRSVKHSRGTQPHVIFAVLSDPKLNARSIVTFQLNQGGAIDLAKRRGITLSDNDLASISTIQGSLSLVEEARRPLVKVKEIKAVEGAQGYFIEVSCSDLGVGETTQAYIANNKSQLRQESNRLENNPYSEQVSKHCLFDDKAKSNIQINPAVPFSILPSTHGIRLWGAFKRGVTTVQIQKETTSVDGSVVKSSFEGAVSIPVRMPKIGFVSSGRYLPKNAWNSLPINHMNVDHAQLEIRQVPPENLVFWMSEAEYRDSSEAATERTSNLLFSKTLALPNERDKLSTTWVDVASLLPQTTQGLLQLRLKIPGSTATARLLLTNMNLVVKKDNHPQEDKSKSPQRFRVWALQMESNDLLSGVEVKLIRKSGNVLARCTTQGSEGCILTLPPRGTDPDPSPPFALIAQKGEDLTYLKFSELKTEISEEHVSGSKYAQKSTYFGSMYSDRDLYRPSETAHLVGILRESSLVAPAQSVPVEIEIQDPRGKAFRHFQVQTNAAGMFFADVKFADFADTGKYHVSAKVAERTVANYAIQVEEFVPERMKVEAKAVSSHYLQGSPVEVQVNARYLFGSLASQHQTELSCEIISTTFSPKSNGNFHYGPVSLDGEYKRALPYGGDTHLLDDQGQGVFSCLGTEPGALPLAPLRVSASVSVLEAGSGRTTKVHATATVHPEKYYLGLQTSAPSAQAGKPISLSLITVDWSGEKITNVKDVDVEFFKIENNYGWYYDESEGGSQSSRSIQLIPEGKIAVHVESGMASFPFTPGSDADRYLIRARAGHTYTELVIPGSGYHYYYFPSESMAEKTPRPLRATPLAIEVPKEAALNKATTIHVKAPYRGKILLTVETDEVLISEWKSVEAGDVSWSFTLNHFLPNVYVSAFLIKDPHLDSAQAFLPDRAFGVLSLPIERTEYTQPVQIQAPTEVKSRSRLDVKLHLEKAEGPTFVTVAAVDEGILSLTHFSTPDPLDDIFVQRALGTETFETAGWTMLLPPSGTSRSTGGDGDAEMAAVEKPGDSGDLGRIMMVKPVALWSGIVSVPQSGDVPVSLQLPSYRGSLRIMAVSVSPKKIGRATSQVLVRDPITIQATFPRFGVAGDEISIPVSISNLSGKEQKGTVSLLADALPVPGMQASGMQDSPLSIVGKPTLEYQLANGATTVVVFHAKVKQAVGAAKLRVLSKAGSLESQEEAEVPILAAGPESRLIQKIELASGKPVDLLPLLKGWVPMSERSTIQVTPNPYADVFEHLSFLIHYPYGCVEQTTSSLRPLLAFSKLGVPLSPTILDGKPIDTAIHAGIERLFSMQTPSGGFGFWPGDREAYLWGTAYATHFLLDAKAQGYLVPAKRLEEALRFIQTTLVALGNAKVFEFRYSKEAEPYLHYVLALAQRANLPWKANSSRIQQLIHMLPKQPKGEDLEIEYMLKAALYLSGDRRYEQDLRKLDVTTISEERSNTWSLYSDRRRRGFMLSTFVDLFGRDPQAEPLANMVANALRTQQSSYYTTQELVLGIVGLAKFLAPPAKLNEAPTLLAGGKKRSAQGGDAEGVTTWSLARASEYPSLVLQVPKFEQGKLYLILHSEGVRTVPDWKLGNQGLIISRRYLTQTGSPLFGSDLQCKLGEVITEEITVENPGSELLSNVVLVDRIPAGFEIENSRLAEGDSSKKADSTSAWIVDHENFRDDRIEVFGSLPPKKKLTLIYQLRATVAGTFTIPTLFGEAMYDPRIWARSAGGKLVVTAPWKE